MSSSAAVNPDTDDSGSSEASGSTHGAASFLPAVGSIDGMRQAVHNLKQEVVEISYDMKETLKRLQGQVFHAVGRHGSLYRYRIGFDGRLTLEKRLKITAGKLNETREKLVEAGKAVPIKAQRRWRAAVTGDPNKRIRDHMKETPQVKMVDKLSFTLGVIVICFSEYLLLRHPDQFPYLYYCLMPLLFVLRYIEYSAIKSEMYMLDFCYFVNLSVALQTFFAPDNVTWFQANYILSMGPICLAIVVWRNSLVFHSLDKITSFFLHAFPPMICHIYRWHLVKHGMDFSEGYMGLKSHFANPLILYLLWQAGYLFITEVLLGAKLRADPDIVTSFRYLTRDHKNQMNRSITKICRQIGCLRPDQTFDPDTLLAKVVFVLSQLAYTVATIALPAFLYMSYDYSCYYILVIFVSGVWNGASYYIEVFSKRYNLKFEDKALSSSEDQLQSDCTSMEEEKEHEESFVEALEDLDLSDPSTLQLYEQLFQPALPASSLHDDDDHDLDQQNHPQSSETIFQLRESSSEPDESLS